MRCDPKHKTPPPPNNCHGGGENSVKCGRMHRFTRPSRTPGTCSRGPQVWAQHQPRGTARSRPPTAVNDALRHNLGAVGAHRQGPHPPRVLPLPALPRTTSQINHWHPHPLPSPSWAANCDQAHKGFSETGSTSWPPTPTRPQLGSLRGNWGTPEQLGRAGQGCPKHSWWGSQ